jgi:hypothetical protein
MKFISPSAMAAIAQRTGVSPVVVISVLWGHDLRWYTSRRVEIPGIISEARITGLGNVSCEKRTDNRSTTGSLSFELDDSDGALKFYVDNVRVEQAKATAWMWLDGTHFDDRVLILDGLLSSPDWNDDERHLKLTLETLVEREEFGFAPTKEDFADLSDESVGTGWPMAFGTVKNLPAVRVRQKTIGTLTADIRFTFAFENFSDLEEQKKLKIRSYIPNGAAEAFEDNAIYVTNGNKFTQDKEITLNIDGVLFKGKFTGDKFNVTFANYPRYQNVQLENISTLPEGEISLIAAATAGQGATVAVLVDSKISLSNMFCYCRIKGSANTKLLFNYCTRQINKTAIFKYPFYDVFGRHVNAAQIEIMEVYAIAKNGLTREDVERIWYFRSRYGATVSDQEYQLLNNTVTSPSSFWRRQAGTPITLNDYLDPDVYVVSGIKMETIDSVYAKKKVTVLGKERKIFTPIPKPYYQKQLASNYQVNGQNVSGLIFHTPMAEYQDQEWEDTVYVSGTSTIGPNPVDIIKFVLDEYTELITDATFDTVKAKVNDHPANFVLFDRRNALAFAQEIAWQSRCVILLDSNVVSIRYLGEVPNTLMLFDESNIDVNSIIMSTTPITDIVTRFVGTWTDDYKDSPQPQSLNLNAVRDLSRILKTLMPDTYRERTATKMYTRTENVDIYGFRTEEVNVYIYNNEESVKKTIDFWGHRAANSWKKIRFRALNLDAAALQPYDGVAIAMSTLPLELNVIGTVESTHYDHASKTVTLDVWLPLLAGSQAVDSRAYTG